MSSLRRLTRQSYRRATWKNGLGYTDEIAIYPEGADLRRGDFLWRLSSARIENASPFSAFPGHDRILVVLDGAGVRLTHTFEEGAEDTAEVLPLEPYEFPGDIPSRCELVAGPITDLSVFVRKGEIEASVEVREILEGESFDWVPAANWNFLFVAGGGLSVQSLSESQGFEALRGDTLLLESRESSAMTLQSRQGPSQVVVISLTRP